MKVPPYNTDSPHRSQQERAVYHDDDECPFGRKLFNASQALGPERIDGTGDKPYCRLCK